MSTPNTFCLRLFITGTILLFISMVAAAQVEYGGEPASELYGLPPSGAEAMVLGLDKEMRQDRDSLSKVQEPGIAAHAGFAVPASAKLRDKGQWDVAGNHLHVWRIRIESPEALATGLNFSNFTLGSQARLFVYDPEKEVVLGSFDHRNNSANGKFATAVIPGDAVIIEYQEPYYPGKPEEMTASTFALESVIHISNGGTMPGSANARWLDASGDCMVNVNCPEGAEWQDQKRGIARMLMRTGDSYGWCTGSLVNNTAQDATPYFLSAEHCGRNATAEDMLFWQFYFNLETRECENKEFPPINMVFGADALALGELEGGSDFRLLELHTSPPPHWRPYWNGWDRTNDGSSSGVGIHHPRGDVKKISTYNFNLLSAGPSVSGQQMAQNSTWQVQWTETQTGIGVTEQGSSGSPIFNQDKKIIGTLTGGTTDCENTDGYDFYGKIWYHWDQNGTDVFKRLDQHLDPLGTEAGSLSGLDPYENLQPSPGFLEARVDQDKNARIAWYAPGNAPNKDGWYQYADDFTHLTWTGPKRVTAFDAHALGLNYPIQLSKVSHVFVQHGDHPWPDDRFRFVVYDTDGHTLLYQSDELIASHLQEYVYELAETLVFDDYFYVGIQPSDASGHPSSLMRRVNLGQGYSFYGTEGDWQAHDQVQDQNFEGSFAYLTAIYVGESREAYQGHEMQIHHDELQDLHRNSYLREQMQEAQSMEMAAGILPDSYRLYRDDELIHTAGFDEEMQFTNILPDDGFYRFHATAMYGNNESARSNTAYLLRAADCEVLIDSWPYTEEFDQDFDDTCWISEALKGDGWELMTSYGGPGVNLAPEAGDKFYLAAGTEAGIHDEWLITPLMDFSTLEHPALRFVFSGHKANDEETAYLTMRISDDGKGFEKMWDSRHYPGFAAGDHPPDWLPATVNLKRFSGRDDVRLAFQFAGGEGSFFALDQLQVLDGNTIAFDLEVTTDPDNAGTVNGSGTYLEGETVNLRASANVGHMFMEWLKGGQAIGQQETLQLLMPGSDTSLTASFIDLATDVEHIADTDQAFRVFPNPATNQLHVRLNDAYAETVISLVNMQGQLLKQKQLHHTDAGQEVSLQTGSLARGLYLLRLQTDQKKTVFRVVLTE